MVKNGNLTMTNEGCPYMVLETKVNQYIAIVIISAKRFKNKTFRLFVVLSFKEIGFSQKSRNFNEKI